ncbi:MAG: tryptophan--tRNA ligase [Deltaproteobacteria bacterium RBG_16_54_11]|nr:MAG: tryptophan--tRNA ligase [Deltaproteobacteria bacterium RBG_16_54_11]
MKKRRVLSGMRPTGKTHVGHLHGILENWRDLQDQYECFYFAADWHALTSEYKNTAIIKESLTEMIIDWLSVGIDPRRSTLFVQSWVKEHAELHLLLSMITPLGWLERNPTYKEQQEELAEKDIGTYGFLGYPVLQAADILMYKGNFVPVGKDQLPHLEITREIARRFNYLYREVFPCPEALLTQVPNLGGIDGRKMSKSYNNAIFISDSPDVLAAKIEQMITDPQRAYRKDPGDPDVCGLFPYHRIYSEPAVVAEINGECRQAGVGCRDCKRILLQKLQEYLTSIQEKRRYYLAHLEEVKGIIHEGTERAREVAQHTMGEVREALGL